jgi:hypothetical protein
MWKFVVSNPSKTPTNILLNLMIHYHIHYNLATDPILNPRTLFTFRSGYYGTHLTALSHFSIH